MKSIKLTLSKLLAIEIVITERILVKCYSKTRENRMQNSESLMNKNSKKSKRYNNLKYD